MNMHELPKTYKGYSTAELLDILEKIPGGEAKNIPMETMSVFNDFVMDYELTYMARKVAGDRRAREAKQNLN